MKYEILENSIVPVYGSTTLYEVTVKVTDDCHHASNKRLIIKSTPHGVFSDQEQIMKDFPEQNGRNHIHLWVKRRAADVISTLMRNEE